MSTALIILPIFAIILAGFLCGRSGLFGANAASELNRFVVYLALPALLFHAMATADWGQLWQPGFIAAFAIGTAAIFAATMIAQMMLLRRSMGESALDALNAGYSNTAYVGIPLCVLLFGPQSLPLPIIATIVTACALFAIASILIELDLHRGPQADKARAHQLVGKLFLSLLRNPLVASPLLGCLWATTGIGMPGSIGTGFTLLGGAASPCALVSLGLFLSARPIGRLRGLGLPATLTVMKLLVQPVVTFALAFHFFAMPARVAAAAVILAALPTGTGAFMAAEYYRRDATVTARAILLSTVASVITLTLWIDWLGYGAG